MMLNNKLVPVICTLVSVLILILTYTTSNLYSKTAPFGGTRSRINFLQNNIRNQSNTTDKLFEKYWYEIIQNYIPLPLENGYGSHKLVLLAASILTTEHGGPVMEMGCGYHSTILLHQIVVIEQKRYLLSTDTDREWLSKFETNMSLSLHHFRHVRQTSDWDHIGTDRHRWSIVFIDHKPGERRVIDIIRLANISDILIVHDTETDTYDYDQGFSHYPYRYRYNYLPVYNDVMSKFNETLFRNIQYLLELTIKMNLSKL